MLQTVCFLTKKINQLVLSYKHHHLKAFLPLCGYHNNKESAVILLSNDNDKYVRNAKVWGIGS